MYEKLLTLIVAWFISQSMKTVLYRIKLGHFDLKKSFQTGGMPSIHTTVVTAVTTLVAFNSGFDSILFVVSLGFSIIVIHDALTVRPMIDLHSQILNNKLGQFLRENVGHRFTEVIAGITMGVSTVVIFSLI